MKGFAFCAAFAIAAATLTTSYARNFGAIEINGPASLPDGADTPPPPGFVGFCMRWPAACVNSGKPKATKLTLSDSLAETLVRVNDDVNHSIRYESSIDHYGVPNVWTLGAADGYGNCEDYSVTKREALRAAGLPGAALRIAIVRTPKGEFHAVLTVDTDKGVLVLDNVDPAIRNWWDTPYTWLKRQAADDPLHWVNLNVADR